jgi:outer membrane protein insertion porin family
MQNRHFRRRGALSAVLVFVLMSWPVAGAQNAVPAGGTSGAAQAQEALAPQNPAPCAPGSPNEGKVMVPPPGTGPVYRTTMLTFPKQGDVSSIEPATYLYYIQTLASRPCQTGTFIPWNEQIDQRLLADYQRLWGTKFLTDLTLEVVDEPYENGVIGKRVVFVMEERERVKIVQYTGSKQFEQSKAEERLRELGITIRLDSFVDDSQIRRIKTVIGEMLAEKGYPDAKVTPEVKPVAGGPKLVHLTFVIDEGPKIQIRDIDFVGNRAFSDGKLKGRMKENKEKGMLSFLMGGGTYQEAKFEEDAQKIIDFYRERGYLRVGVGQPDLRTLQDSKDRKTRWVQVRIPIEEGARYKVGDFGFDGNTVVKAEILRPLFKLKTGAWYNEKRIRDGFEKARELYGAGGYMEFTGFPDYAFRGANAGGAPTNGSPSPTNGGAAATNGGKPPVAAPIVDMTLRVQEGKQYFINRITFVGNTTTRDNVIRREVRLYENGVFDTEALKFSVRRLNQLGYFKPVEDQKNIKIDKTPGADNKVDMTLTFEEQNRNQLTFGAGVSQYDGVFAQIGFQTANFMGRGEALTLNIQSGARADNYQLSFTEPFLFDRPITGGIDLFNRNIQYIGSFTQASKGGNIVFGWPLGNFTRGFVNYSYEQVSVRNINQAFLDPNCLFSTSGCSQLTIESLRQQSPELLTRNPYLADMLLIGQNGRRTISKVTPSMVFNTVDQPIFPTTGKRLTLSMGLAGIGGNTSFYKPHAEFIAFFRHTGRTSAGFRILSEFISPVGSTTQLPIFERLYLGGGYTIRGYDIRSIGPTDQESGLVLGGNKSLLFNGEYLITIAGPVRLVFFYDAGQVRDIGQWFAWKEPRTRKVQTVPWVPAQNDRAVVLNPVTGAQFQTVTIGHVGAFKTSTGAELRFFMPVLNVPFRLIFAYNGNREGVLDNNLQQEKKFKFRFDVGTTF